MELSSGDNSGLNADGCNFMFASPDLPLAAT